MKILVALTYYTPYVSGLTIYAQRIAKAWARQGHEVTVLTSRHSKELAQEEMMDGVRVIRAPILFRITKGAIMPAFWLKAIRLAREADVISLHLPQFDAAWVALLGKINRKYTVITYHCDLMMPSGFLNGIANKVTLWMNDLAGKFSDTVVGYTEDYANYSFYLPKFREKLAIIPPPVELPEVSDEAVAAFKKERNPDGKGPIIGMACRLAADKGVEVLLKALPRVMQEFPEVRVFFAGPYQDVLGEKAYYEKLKPIVEQFEKSGNWVFLGSLPPIEMAKFYRTIDALTMPSLNRTDSFGLVQIEAMMNGKPVVAANLPGIRVPVTRHEMGEIVPIGDADALAEGLIRVLRQSADDSARAKQIAEFYQPDRIADLYEELFRKHGINAED